MGDTPLTPGSVVVPYRDDPGVSQAVRGDTGAIVAATNNSLGFGVLDLASTDGMNLVSEVNEGDQANVLYFRKGDLANVRVAESANIVEGDELGLDPANPGWVTAGGAPIGIAREANVVVNADKPTFILMEVL